MITVAFWAVLAVLILVLAAGIPVVLKLLKLTRTDRKVNQVQRRVEKIGTADLSGWVEQALNHAVRSISDHRRFSAPGALKESILATETVAALLRELDARTRT